MSITYPSRAPTPTQEPPTTPPPAFPSRLEFWGDPSRSATDSYRLYSDLIREERLPWRTAACPGVNWRRLDG